MSIYNFLLRKWTKYILSPYVHYIQQFYNCNCSADHYSQSSVANTFIKPGIRRLLGLNQPTNQPYNVHTDWTKVSETRKDCDGNGENCRTLDITQQWLRTVTILEEIWCPKALVFKSCNLLLSAVPSSPRISISDVGTSRHNPRPLHGPRRGVNKTAEPQQAALISSSHEGFANETPNFWWAQRHFLKTQLLRRD